MNDSPDEMPKAESEALLEEAISRLKRVEPPLETRIANRQAVAAALESLGTVNRQRELPWWQRSVAVPVPLAIAIGMLMAVLVAASFYRSGGLAKELVNAPARPAPETKVQPEESSVGVKPQAAAVAAWMS